MTALYLFPLHKISDTSKKEVPTRKLIGLILHARDRGALVPQSRRNARRQDLLQAAVRASRAYDNCQLASGVDSGRARARVVKDIRHDGEDKYQS